MAGRIGMAEGMDEPEAEVEALLEQANPDAVALALGRTGRGKSLDAKAEAFLDRQSRLLEIQTEHLHEQRELALSHLRWRRFSDRMRAMLQVMTALVGLLVAGGLAVMATSAANERGLVIEPFSVPPDLAQRGLTGQVIASMVLDKLGEMQNATNSSRSPSTYANDWNDQIKVEIPETGVSVGELERLMVRWLGHQTTISGELYRTPAGLSLAARTGTAPARSHAGGEGDIDALVQAAAEDVYGATQPYRYAVYLGQRGDRPSLDRSMQALRRLAVTGDRYDRLWALNALSTFLDPMGDRRGAMGVLADAIAIEPGFGMTYNNLGDVQRWAGEDEAALADYRKASLLARRSGRRFLTPSAVAYLRGQSDGFAAALQGDYRAATQALGAGLQTRPDDSELRAEVSEFQAFDHDPEAARASASALPMPAANDPSFAAPFERDEVRRAKAAAAIVLEDWAGVRQAWTDAEPGVVLDPQTLRLTIDQPYLALAAAELGDAAGARAR